MTIKELTPDNAGCACKYFRKYILKETQNKWAIDRCLTPSNVSGFENCRIQSFNVFFAYIRNGLLDHLGEIPIEDVTKDMEFCHTELAYKDRRY